MRKPVLVAVLVCLLFGCSPKPPPPPPAKIPTTYKVITGVSMGAIGASALGFSRPERFDGIGSLGGPLDAAYFQRMLDSFLMGGFCPRERLEALAASDPTRLNDPATIDACARPATPARWEHANDFNHWHVTNNGGTFDRDQYINMMSDLSLAFGNFFTDNPSSPYAPPGVPAAAVRSYAADFCSHPTVVKGVYNAEYNPTGAHDAITFCDGEPTLLRCRATQERVDFCSDPANVTTPLPVAQEQVFAEAYCTGKGGAEVVTQDSDPLYWLDHAGRFDACRQAISPVGTMLAVDFNGNGRRDYGEPPINNSHERYDDVGADGCPDARENGSGGCNATEDPAAVDPNHDNYDADAQPLGTEGNWQWDQGEPFRDDGLDGVPGTHDSGEGNGTFDLVAGRQKLYALDGRTTFKAMTPAQRARLFVLGDGGIRDIFNLGLMAKHLFSAVAALRGGAVGSYRAFTDIPGSVDRYGNFQPWNRGWGRVPSDILMLYGKEQPTDDERRQGEGDHVGTPGEAFNRFAVAFNWAAAKWPSLPRPATPTGGSTATDRQHLEWFQSTALGAKWEYAVALPPGYDDAANAGARYPVMYMLHGYGMEPRTFLGTATVTDLQATNTDVNFRPMIYVFPMGRCCYVNATGGRDCRSTDDSGVKLSDVPGWARECHSGTFWVNRAGYGLNDATKYGDAFFELMDVIDAKYRTLPAVEVEAR